jgi:FkbM family methyltransferase
MEFSWQGKKVRIQGVSDSDWIYSNIKRTKAFYELDLLRYFQYAMANKSGCILDIGANIGNHSVYFGTYVSEKVVCFEPNSTVIPCLVENLSANLINHKIFKLGLGDRETKAQIELPSIHKNNIGAARLVENLDGEGESIRVATLDSLLPEIKAYIKDLQIIAVKMDVEGMEPSVLRGGIATLKEFKPDLFVEILTPEQMEQVESVVTPIGYKRIVTWGVSPVWHFAHRDRLSRARQLRLTAYIVLEKKIKVKLKKIGTYMSTLPRRIYGRIRRECQRILSRMQILEWKASVRFTFRRPGKKHNLPSPVIISLTSYPARFNTLHLTLKCLLSQSIAPDRVILWIAHQDKNALTPAILQLQKSGLEIAYCDDLRSYKKIIPTLINFPDHFIVTADDDAYYWTSWLEELVSTYQQNTNNVIFHRGHRMILGQDGLPLPYSKWELHTQRIDASPLNFQTGFGGVLYPPNTFHKEVIGVDTLMKLCPLADDIWLYWMMRLNGVVARKVPLTHNLYHWADTQQTALWRKNKSQGGNDILIKNMLEHYGNIFSGFKNA